MYGGRTATNAPSAEATKAVEDDSTCPAFDGVFKVFLPQSQIGDDLDNE